VGQPVAYCKEPRDYFAPSCEGNILQGAEFQITVQTFKRIHLFDPKCLAKFPEPRQDTKLNHQFKHKILAPAVVLVYNRFCCYCNENPSGKYIEIGTLESVPAFYSPYQSK
jgi:hypothetical protein